MSNMAIAKRDHIDVTPSGLNHLTIECQSSNDWPFRAVAPDGQYFESPNDIVGDVNQRRTNMNRSCLATTALVVLLAPMLGHAQSDLDDRFSISLGGFITDWGTNTQLNSDTLGSGTNIDFEDDLGLDPSDTTFRVDGYFRFNDRHRMDLSVFALSRDASKAIQKDIQFGDATFVIDTVIDAKSDLSIYKLDYTYSFLRRDRGSLGVSAGLYVADVEIRLSAQGLGLAENRGITAPLPVFGLRGDYLLNDRFTLRGIAEFFALEINDIDGSIIDLLVSVDYQMSKHTALGLGYNYVAIDADASSSDFSGSLDWSYDGALLFLKLDF